MWPVNRSTVTSIWPAYRYLVEATTPVQWDVAAGALVPEREEASAAVGLAKVAMAKIESIVALISLLPSSSGGNIESNEAVRI